MSTKVAACVGVVCLLIAEVASGGVTVNIGDGADGSFVVPAGQTVTWGAATGVVTTSLTVATQSNQNQISVASTAGFKRGDEVLLYVDRAKDSTGAAGQYQTLYVTSVQGNNTLTLSQAPSAIYNPSQEVVSVQRVPNFTNVTINGTLAAPGFNGTSGGVIFFRADGTLTIAGTITASGAGFAGGPFGNYGDVHPGQSWSLDGVGSGGADFGAGGSLGADPTLQQLLLGSGGATGHGPNFGTGQAGNGGSGGGLIYAAANTIAMTGSIAVSGAGGGGGGYGTSGGGGGSGGEVWLQCWDATGMTSTIINRSGGNGAAGDHGWWSSPGGPGLCELDFHYGPGSYAGADHTMTVDGVVQAPEPASMALAALGVLGMLRRKGSRG